MSEGGGTHGAKWDESMGALKKGIGKIIGSETLQAKGELQLERGKAKEDLHRAEHSSLTSTTPTTKIMPTEGTTTYGVAPVDRDREPLVGYQTVPLSKDESYRRSHEHHEHHHHHPHEHHLEHHHKREDDLKKKGTVKKMEAEHEKRHMLHEHPPHQRHHVEERPVLVEKTEPVVMEKRTVATTTTTTATAAAAAEPILMREETKTMEGPMVEQMHTKRIPVHEEKYVERVEEKPTIPTATTATTPLLHPTTSTIREGEPIREREVLHERRAEPIVLQEEVIQPFRRVGITSTEQPLPVPGREGERQEGALREATGRLLGDEKGVVAGRAEQIRADKHSY
ncbi:Glycosyltransferase family 8 protein [Balamuthia mandrillaris]